VPYVGGWEEGTAPLTRRAVFTNGCTIICWGLRRISNNKTVAGGLLSAVAPLCVLSTAMKRFSLVVAAAIASQQCALAHGPTEPRPATDDWCINGTPLDIGECLCEWQSEQACQGPGCMRQMGNCGACYCLGRSHESIVCPKMFVHTLISQMRIFVVARTLLVSAVMQGLQLPSRQERQTAKEAAQGAVKESCPSPGVTEGTGRG